MAIDWTKKRTINDQYNEAQTKKISEIANKRYNAECSGCTWTKDGIEYVVATDRDSRAMLQATREIAMNTTGFTTSAWKMKNNVFVDLTITDMTDIGLLMGIHVQQCFDKEKELLALVKSQPDMDSVNAVVIDFSELMVKVSQ